MDTHSRRHSDSLQPPSTGNPAALMPIVIFLVLYLGLGIIFEYVLHTGMGFYNIPVVVIFMIALTVACLQNRKVSFDEKLSIMAQGVGHKDILTMILIFLSAGIFVGVTGRSSAESVAYFMLSVIPAEFSVAVLFVVSSFISVSMGTSVGTISLITPIAVAVATSTGFDVALCIAAVMGGAMFGDNLSFISDTTIAACNGQGCPMREKFSENIWIALPAFVATLVVILVISSGGLPPQKTFHEYNLLKILPYILVLVGGIFGINVFILLFSGIVSSFVIMTATGTGAAKILADMGAGCAGMFETSMVAILVAAICSLIKANRGFDTVLWAVRSLFHSHRGGQLGIGLLVGMMDIATANNTVAIVMANPIARDIAVAYDVSRSRTASILDTFSCVFQGIIPYGAQMLVAISATGVLGVPVSPFHILPRLYYPYMLLISSLVFIAWRKRKAS